jgi:hypothetical protein
MRQSAQGRGARSVRGPSGSPGGEGTRLGKAPNAPAAQMQPRFAAANEGLDCHTAKMAVTGSKGISSKDHVWWRVTCLPCLPGPLVLPANWVQL